MECAGLLEMFSKTRYIIFAIMWKVWDSLKCFKDVKKNRDCVESAGSQKMPRWKVILLSLWKVQVLRRFLVKFQQLSMGSWVNASCLISGETAGSLKMRQWKVIFLSISVEEAGC